MVDGHDLQVVDPLLLLLFNLLLLLLLLRLFFFSPLLLRLSPALPLPLGSVSVARVAIIFLGDSFVKRRYSTSTSEGKRR